ncbi:MAG: hypothetical protein V1899_00440 [Planctomycetota bacterium]
MRLLLISILFVAFNVFAAEETTPGDSEYFLSAANQAEEEWAAKRSQSYPETIKKLCFQLSEGSTERREQRGKNWYATMQTIAGRFFTKEETNLLGSQMRVAMTLANLPHEIPDEATLDNMRSITFRLVMIVIERVRRKTIPNYVMRHALMNPCSWVDSTNEVAMKKHNAILKEHSENARMNLEQGMLASFQEDDFPIMEGLIIAAYSKYPVRYEELRDYLILGRYTPSERSRIFAAVTKATKKCLPPFFDTSATEQVDKQ